MSKHDSGRSQFRDEMQRRSDACEEALRSFFDSIDIDKPFEPWKTDRWAERRKELIGEECVWCGDTDNLQVHHEEHGPKWPSMWNDARNMVFFEEHYQPEKYAPHTAVCPACLKGTYRGRVTKTPPYVCGKCSHEFSDPLLYPRQDSDLDDLWSDITDFTESHQDDITERFSDLFWNEWEAYFEGEDTVTLCRGCHHKIDGRNSYRAMDSE